MIPKQLRDHLGLRPGPIEVVADGTDLRVRSVADDTLGGAGDRLVIPATGTAVSDDDVQALRDADRR